MLTLDVESDQVIRLELHGLDSELPAALIVMDVLGVVGVPVHAYAGGRLSSSALGVLASCSHRRANLIFAVRRPWRGFRMYWGGQMANFGAKY